MHQDISSDEHPKIDLPTGAVGQLIEHLSSDQYQQLMTLLFHHLSSSIQDNPHQDNTTYAAGTCFSISQHHAYSSKNLWILDSRATTHICSNANAFTSLRPIWNSMVTLPNNTCIPVRLHGDIRINSQLILKDVLLVPQFHINLMSVSALTAISPLTISFFANHFIIQDSTNQKMIGKGDRDKDLYILDVDKFNLMSANVSLQTRR